MNSWIFYLTDSKHTMSAVVGTSDNIATAEEDALAKWDTAVSGLDDYAERTPIINVLYSTLSTELDDKDIPGLIL